MANSNVKNDVAVLGIDLAKQSFQLHGVDSNGITVLKKKLARKKLSQFIALMPPLSSVLNLAMVLITGCVFLKSMATLYT